MEREDKGKRKKIEGSREEKKEEEEEKGKGERRINFSKQGSYLLVAETCAHSLNIRDSTTNEARLSCH